MNDEIKEIEHIMICLKEHIALSDDEDTYLLDYITNLQQKIEQYENPDDMTLFYMWLDVKAKDKMKELQQENERLKEQLKKDNHILGCNFASKDKYKKKYEDYKSRCEKADEFIKKTPFINHITKLSIHNILQNGSDDNE